MKNSPKFLFLLLMPILLQAQSDCSYGESYTDLDFNNITAGLLQGGSLWWNDGHARYFAKPETGEPEVKAIYAGGLWLGGKHPDGNVRIAAPTYGHGNSNRADFFPGPINELTGTVLPEDCTNWDKHFKILRSEINSHIIDFANDNEVDIIDSVIYSWPGKDNPHFFDFNGFVLPEGQDLAPYIDNNGDNIYNPSDGDYPDIKGDQAVWWVFNDIANEHTSSNSEPIQIEVQAMAYAYQSFEPAIDNTTFYDFKLKYYGEETLEEFQVGIWTDVDLGCYTDDRFGIDTTKNMSYHYNIDAIDGEVFGQCGAVETYGMEIPMLGIKLLNDSENLGVTSYNYMTGSSESFPDAFTAMPSSPVQYHRFMSGRWRNDSPIINSSYGANPSVSGDTTLFVFNGNPSAESEWSMCSASSSINPDMDRRTVMSSGGTPLHSGDIRELSYAVIFVPNVSHPCPDLIDICTAADVVQEFDGVTSSILSIKEVNELSFSISPNPTTGQFSISTPLNTPLIEQLEIRDIAGKFVWGKDKLKANSYTVNRNDLGAGIYFITVINAVGKIGIEKVVFQ